MDKQLPSLPSRPSDLAPLTPLTPLGAPESDSPADAALDERGAVSRSDKRAAKQVAKQADKQAGADRAAAAKAAKVASEDVAKATSNAAATVKAAKAAKATSAKAAKVRSERAAKVKVERDRADEATRARARGEKPPGQRWYEITVGRTVKPEVVMAFARQVASFLEAGISVIETLEIVREEIGVDAMQRVIDDMSTAIQRGSSFADAVGAHPTVFPAYFRAMVRSAEFTGKLDEVLNQLAAYLDRDITARRQVKSALTYPTVVLFVATAAMIVMSIFVLPKFSSMYRSLGAKLPLPTKMLLGFTDFMTNSWMFLIVGGIAVFLLAHLTIGGKRGKPRRDRLVMKLPVIGNLFHLISIERFCRVLAALAKAGVPLPDAIEMSAASTNNTIFQEKLATVKETLIRGGGLSAPMFDVGVFPVAARQMIRVGERTGSLSHQLSRAAAYYEREVAFQMKRATELFQPAVILFVGFIVGFVAVAQVAAMYSIFGQVH